MAKVNTIKVIRKSDGAACVVNEADFNAELHEAVGEDVEGGESPKLDPSDSSETTEPVAAVTDEEKAAARAKVKAIEEELLGITTKKALKPFIEKHAFPVDPKLGKDELFAEVRKLIDEAKKELGIAE